MLEAEVPLLWNRITIITTAGLKTPNLPNYDMCFAVTYVDYFVSYQLSRASWTERKKMAFINLLEWVLFPSAPAGWDSGACLQAASSCRRWHLVRSYRMQIYFSTIVQLCFTRPSWLFSLRIRCQNKERDEIRVAELSFSIFIASRFADASSTCSFGCFWKRQKKERKESANRRQCVYIYIYIYFIASKSWFPNARRAGVGGEFEKRGSSRGVNRKWHEKAWDSQERRGARGFVQTAYYTTEHDAVRHGLRRCAGLVSPW